MRWGERALSEVWRAGRNFNDVNVEAKACCASLQMKNARNLMLQILCRKNFQHKEFKRVCSALWLICPLSRVGWRSHTSPLTKQAVGLHRNWSL